MPRITKQFRLGYKLGRLHGRWEGAQKAHQAWGEFVSELQDAANRNADRLNQNDLDAMNDYTAELEAEDFTFDGLESVVNPTQKADRKTRRRLKAQEQSWAREQAERDHSPIH